ncbi:MAG: response regulator [Hyphomicrobium sp.]
MPQSNEPVFSVLCVDDEQMALKYFAMAFSDDYSIVTASSADEAESLIRAAPHEFAIVISDQRMPGRTGSSLLESVRQSHPSIVRILTTAYSDLESAIDCVNRGEVFRYIVKPWNFDYLRQELRIAMQVFHLQRDRDALLAEKLSVKQMLNAVARAQSIMTASGAFPEIPSMSGAVADYVSTMVGLASAAPSAEAHHLDMWAQTEAETMLMTSLIRELSKLNDTVRVGAPASQPSSAAAALDGSSALQTLLAAANGEQFTTLTNGNLIGELDHLLRIGLPRIMNIDTTGIQSSLISGKMRISAEGPALITESDALLFAYPPVEEFGAATSLLKAYILAAHADGSVSITESDGKLHFLMDLPLKRTTDRGAVDIAIVSKRMFRSFERWD